ncbi:OLC1v1032955C1 [Oldenlandia corymbosa var. corymbosa]|uniref:OLC1v1032955C1 n=1 Tax=Oldenlandia corymbosa var. corymbosa TaxID=529605 RepID=A0AAV1CMG0_OLDCO|nr:OLC1v1032955C1 [Oldenlandia corymbosa var. corymbosa]
MNFHQESEEAIIASPIQESGDGFPHEALFLALSYLPVYELLVLNQVCRSFREALKNDILPWLNIVVGKPLNKRLNDDHLFNLTSKAQGRLHTLALLNCSRITDDGLLKVIAANPLITQLWLPGCTSLNPSGVIEAVKLLRRDNHRLKCLKIRGIYNIKKEDLEILHQLIDDENLPMQKEEMNLYHNYNDLSPFQQSGPAIDVDVCPRCDEVRGVFDCPRDSCRTMKQHQKVMECRGCKLCILRCEECGICIKEDDLVEVACADVLCLDCWLQLPKCIFCNKPYCTQHADQQCRLSGSSGFVCTKCHAKFLQSA